MLAAVRPTPISEVLPGFEVLRRHPKRLALFQELPLLRAG